MSTRPSLTSRLKSVSQQRTAPRRVALREDAAGERPLGRRDDHRCRCVDGHDLWRAEEKAVVACKAACLSCSLSNIDQSVFQERASKRRVEAVAVGEEIGGGEILPRGLAQHRIPFDVCRVEADYVRVLPRLENG